MAGTWPIAGAVAGLLLAGCGGGGGGGKSLGGGNQAPAGTIATPAVASTTIAAGAAVSFTASCVDPEGKTPVTHAWDFGGGAAASSLEDPGAVTFATAGTFTVRYTCTDDQGLADPTPDTRTVVVTGGGGGNQAPSGVVAAPAARTTTIAAGAAVTFNASCVDPDGNTPLTHAWDFGGGAAASSLEDPGAVTFATVGTYTVSYTCTDALGLADPTPDTRTVVVTGGGGGNQAPAGTIATPAAASTTIAAGASVSFTAACTDPDGNTPLTHAWDFGGGAAGSAVQDPGALTFATAGTYTVSYTCTDALGLADPTPDTRTVVVTAPPATPGAAYPYDPPLGSGHSSNPSIAIDGSGGIHMAFSASAGIHYATCAADCGMAGSWTAVQIAQMGITFTNTQIRLDASGRPRVMFFYDTGGNGDEYRYASCDTACTNPASWTIGTAVVANNVGNDTQARSFALDGQDHPAFIYLNKAGGVRGLYHVRCGGTSCTAAASWTQTLLLEDESASAFSLAYGGDGVAHLAYRAPVRDAGGNWTGSNLAYSRCASACDAPASWVGVQPFACGIAGDLQLRVDASDRPHIAFYSEVDGEQIAYVACAAGDCTSAASWAGVTLGAATRDGAMALDLVLDGSGRPRIAYSTAGSTGVGLASCDSSCTTVGSGTWSHIQPETLTQLETRDPVPALAGCMSAWSGEGEERLAAGPGGQLALAYVPRHTQSCPELDPATGLTVWRLSTDKHRARVVLP